MFVGRSKRTTFQYLVDRVRDKVKGCKAKMLSFDGRATLIKAVTSAIPSYAMAHVSLPEAICYDLDACNRKFWWGHDVRKKRNLCIKAWGSLCKPKKVGGLGFKKAREMNKAMIAKLAWQLTAQEDKLWVKLLLNKYCRRYSFFNVMKHNSDSLVWKNILDVRDIIKKELVSVLVMGKILTYGLNPGFLMLKDFVLDTEKEWRMYQW